MRQAAVSVWGDSGQCLAVKCRRRIERGGAITHWCGRQGDVTFLRSLLLPCCQTLCWGWKKCETLPLAFVRWCMCEHAASVSLHLFVCLHFFLPPTTSKLWQERWSMQARSTWRQTKWVRKVLLVCCVVGLQARVCVCVCAGMCDWFYISSGLSCFPAPSKPREKNLRLHETFRRSSEGGLDKRSIKKIDAAAENHWLTSN